jgi:uncharacterized protein (TIGR01244 family)
MNIMRAAAIVLVMLATVGAAAQAPASAAAPAVPVATPEGTGLPVKVTDLEGVEARLYLDGRVYIAGQPSEAALARLKERGVTAVVNLRTPTEMADSKQVPYDEAAAVAALGMEYVHIPLNGRDFPYTTEAVDRFAAVLGRHSGPVVLHCASAGRVSYLWSAYLIRHRGFSLDAALVRGEAIGIAPSPLEGLTGRPVKLVWEDPPAVEPGRE